MAIFLFVDESGKDHRQSPYEVLAGVAIKDQNLWSLVQSVHDAEQRFFGCRYSFGARELKARKILKRKTFRLAQQLKPILPEKRTELARRCMLQGKTTNRQELTALAQAKLLFTSETLQLALNHDVKAFASVVDKRSPVPRPDFLRKDYSYLFERFFYFLEKQEERHYGIVVFDELEKSRSHVLLDQMDQYFKQTRKGQERSKYIIPEPVFVHSDLTTGVQIADLVAYIVCWAVRFKPEMTAPIREELTPFAELVLKMRHLAIREEGLFPYFRDEFEIWSFAWIPDLRSKEERED